VQDKPLKVAFCTPTITEPHRAYIRAMEATVPALELAGIDHGLLIETGSPYISAARATLLRRALDNAADVVVFIDHDIGWGPDDMLSLIQTPGDVVAGAYRFKKSDEEYMGALALDAAGRPQGRHADGTDTLVLRADRVPAGFLKITRAGVERFMRAYPALCYGSPINPSVDLFNHGAHEGVWWGEDYAFSRNWLACGGDLLVLPDLNLTHHSADAAYPGNLHQFLLRQPGGANAQA
jgi:glycosyltransferase involved in cell wall biosynthesis